MVKSIRNPEKGRSKMYDQIENAALHLSEESIVSHGETCYSCGGGCYGCTGGGPRNPIGAPKGLIRKL